MHYHAFRRHLFELLELQDYKTRLSRVIELSLIILIALNVLATALETVDSIYNRYQTFFFIFESFSVFIFTLEYLIRIWVCVEVEPYKSNPRGRLAYALTPMALIDFLAILPFYLSFFVGMDLRFIRVLRLLRLFKLTRYSAAMSMLLDVLKEESSSFFASFFILIVLLVLAASGAYLAENSAQPEKFGSVPAAMWWAVATLTTVGYGDVTPVTIAGKFFGSLVAIVGIGMAALPAGIIANGLANHLRQRRSDLEDEFRAALEDGVIDADEQQRLDELRIKLGISEVVAQNIKEGVIRSANKLCTCPRCGHRFQTRG